MDELERSDLEAWEVDELSSDFEDRVMARLQQEAPDAEPPVDATVVPLEPRRRRGLGLATAAVAIAAAAVLVWGIAVRAPSEVRSGTVAVSDTPAMVELVPGVDAVVSPGGALTWEAGDSVRVEQTRGRVRYEVTPGTAVAVRTPAGTVDVTGTIFSVEVLSMSDVSKLKSRSLLSAAAIASTVLAVVVVQEGSVDASNEHGTVAVAAGERVVMTDASAPRQSAPDEEPPQVAQVPAPAKKSYVSPEQRRRHAATRKKIEDALARRKAAEPEPEPVPETEPESDNGLRAAIDGSLDKEYIRAAVKEDLIPLARECYSNVLEVDPEFGGKLVLDFDIMGDEDVGGIVDGVQPGEGTDVIHPEFIECMSESMMTVEMPPPEGGGVVHVSYPLLFEPG